MPLKSRNLQPDGVRYFIRTVSSHSTVLSVEVSAQDYVRSIVTILRRPGFVDIKAYVADVYILTISDVMEVLLEYPDVNCIIVISNWNHYTPQAKQEASRQGVGVFTLDQFREALNCRAKRNF